MSCTPYTVEGSDTYRWVTPNISLTLFNKDNPLNFINVEALFDSGADISLAPSSIADALGINLTSGQKITISGVSGTGFTAYLHTLGATISGITIDLPVAIAEIDTVPILLGRYGLFDQVGLIEFDNSQLALCLYKQVPPTKELPNKYPFLWRFISRFLIRT